MSVSAASVISSQPAPAARPLQIGVALAPLRAIDVIDADPIALHDGTGAMLAQVVGAIQAGDMATAIKAADAHRQANPRVAAVANLVAALALQQKDYVRAEQMLMTAARLDPQDHKIINNQACLYLNRKEFARAKTVLQVGIKRAQAEFAEYYYNLARSELASGDDMKATLHLDQADRLELLPDTVALRARMLFRRGMVTDAIQTIESNLDRFITSALLHNNLAMMLAMNNQMKEACYHSIQAINLEPTNPYHGYAFGMTNKGVAFHQAAPDLVQAMTTALKMPGVSAGELCQNLQILIQSLPGWREALAQSRTLQRAGIPEFLKQIKAMRSDYWELVSTGLRRSIIRQEQFERLLGTLRSWYLHHLSGGGTLDDQDRDLIQGLMFQNHINEYVTYTPPDDLAILDQWRQNFNHDTPDLNRLMIMICYNRITDYLSEDQIKKISDIPDLAPMIQVQILDPRREFAIMQTLPSLTPIQDDVSLKVEQMYMDHPYPAWVSVNYPGTLDHLDLAPKIQDRIQVLIAGCGTGQHALNVAISYKNVQVTAIDLSRRSLAYAKRKTDELGITNITYAQADLLELGSIHQQFDAIECAGVLHHMRDPLQGLDVLLSLLKPGGTFMIGLYSEIARRGIVAAREEIAKRGLQGTNEDIKAFRNDMMQNPDSELAQDLFWRGDFFTISTCRDLIFHVQEHRFTIPQLQKILADRHLTFLGFNKDPYWTTAFKTEYPTPQDWLNLDIWHQFEVKNPRVFANMYQFVVRKNS